MIARGTRTGNCGKRLDLRPDENLASVVIDDVGGRLAGRDVPVF
jgi:hypothetical protein